MQFLSCISGRVHFPGGLRRFLLGLPLSASRNRKDGSHATLTTLFAGKIRAGLHQRQRKHSWNFGTVCHPVIKKKNILEGMIFVFCSIRL
jgi:hypothetical protein